jgi:hypothetical protein
MIEDELLRLQIEDAVQRPSARYLITAIVDGTEHDAGETVIGPHCDAAESGRIILELASASLRRRSVAIGSCEHMRIVIEDVPLLY